MKKVLKPMIILASIIIILFLCNVVTEIISKGLVLRSYASKETDSQCMEEVEIIDDEQIDEIEENIKEKIPIYDLPLSRELQIYTYEICKEYGVNYEKALAVMKIESSFNSNAENINKNGSKDVGLMQINSINRKWLSEVLEVTDLKDPKQNILAGVYMLSILKEKFGDDHLQLMAYNMGEGKTKQLVSRGVTSSKYSRKVLNYKDEIKQQK